jgi:hypothetical protein
MQVLRLRTSQSAATYFAQDDNVFGWCGGLLKASASSPQRQGVGLVEAAVEGVVAVGLEGLPVLV